MTVTIRSGGRANQRDISVLEDIVGQPLSHGFKEFVASHDGAKPEMNVFEVNAEIESGVNEFIPMKQIVDERSNIENIGNEAYPFAWAEGGNYLLIDEARQGAVFFWDHEVPEESHKVADNFNAFLELLRPFDPSSVQLAPGQVRSAWINPEFLKKFSK